MTKRLYGTLLIAMMLSLLLIFPFLGTFLPGSSVEVAFNKEDVSPFFLEQEQSDIVFVYFGYVGCAHICTPSLQELSNNYETLKRIEPKVKFYFVNLNPDQPKEAPDMFAKAFHNDFIGIYASKEEVEELARIYNLAITGREENMGHSSSLFMFVKHPVGYVLKNIYTTHPYPIKQIIIDLQKVQS